MTSESKRRQYLVKPWFQIRYMLLLVSGIIVGGIVYARILLAAASVGKGRS